MYKLIRLTLNNWYLCTAEDVIFRGSIGIIGPTGSGKSSILDAIQTTLCGMNHNAINLNPSSEVKTKRHIIDYCLGYLTPKADGGEPLRETAETKLIMTFAEEQRDGSVHYVSAGVVMTARKGEAREQPVTRFIASGIDGIGVRASDLRARDKDGEYIRDWEEFQPILDRRCGGKLKEYKVSSERYVNDLLVTLRPGARQPDAHRFLKAFGNALKFAPINDPTKFMRDFILEQDDLDVNRVRDQIARWREWSKAVHEIEAKLQILNGIRKAYDGWARSVIEQAEVKMRRSHAAVERTRLIFGLHSLEYQAAQERIEEQRDILQSMEDKQVKSQEAQKQLLALMGQKDLDGRKAQLDIQRGNLARDLRDIETAIKPIREAFQLAANLISIRDYLPGSFVPVVAAANAALSIMNVKPSVKWLVDGEHTVSEHLAKLKQLAGLPERLQGPREGLETELTEKRRRRDELQVSLQRTDTGGAVLQRHTLKLMELLEKAGISATPVCEVVEVTDTSWQLAAESLLGERREALITEPHEVGKAHEILYKNRNEFELHRCRLVRTDRSDGGDTRVKPGTIASVISTDNHYAQAYIAMNLGGWRMAENEQDLKALPRSIMRNGKSAGGSDYQVHKDRGLQFLLGKTARDQTLKNARVEFDAVKDEIRKLTEKQRALESAAHAAASAAAFSADIRQLASNYSAFQRGERELEARMGNLLTAEEREIAEEAVALETEIAERAVEIRTQNEAITKLATDLGRHQNQVATARKEFRNAAISKGEAIRAFDTDAMKRIVRQFILSTGDKVRKPVNPFIGTRLRYRDQHKEAIAEYETAESDASLRLRDLSEDKLNRLAFSARKRLDEQYCRPYAIDFPHDTDSPYFYDYIWAYSQYERLENNELREHLVQVEEAAKEMGRAIKEDLLSRLTDKFSKLDEQLRALNRHLSKHRFTGQVYRFGKRNNMDFDKVRILALKVAENPDTAQAIIEKRVDDPVLLEGMKYLEDYIEATGGEGLKDYRNYFNFDLYMIPESQAEVEDEKVQGRMSLSARAGVASGGEAQAPFYIAMAASMAMAYFPGGHPTKGPSGMGLVVFDEAFNRLDIANTQALIRFFEELGLQLLVAAPESERTTFTEVFDTLVTVSKSAATRTVYIASEFPKERARQELGAINPNRKGVEGFREELKKQDDAGDKPKSTE